MHNKGPARRAPSIRMLQASTNLYPLNPCAFLRRPSAGDRAGVRVLVPEASLLVFAPDHAVDVEGVHERSEEVALLLVARPGDLRHAVFAEVDLGACRSQRLLH